jgi:uncharacterized cupredoxin-like copper-binding protein
MKRLLAGCEVAVRLGTTRRYWGAPASLRSLPRGGLFSDVRSPGQRRHGPAVVSSRMKWLIAVCVVLVGLVSISCAAAPADALTIRFHYSHFEPASVHVRARTRVSITLRNDDPIDHEWIVGPSAIHEIHRHGTEAVHEGRPTEVSVAALSTKVTTITFDAPGRYAYICHLPGHEEYGMIGELIAS